MLGDNMYGGDSAKDFQNKFEKPYQALLSAGSSSMRRSEIMTCRTVKSPTSPSTWVDNVITLQAKDGIRFFALDSNYMDKKQLDWLKSELKSSAASGKSCSSITPLFV
jgi:hypothetical protein